MPWLAAALAAVGGGAGTAAGTAAAAAPAAAGAAGAGAGAAGTAAALGGAGAGALEAAAPAAAEGASTAALGTAPTAAGGAAGGLGTAAPATFMQNLTNPEIAKLSSLGQQIPQGVQFEGPTSAVSPAESTQMLGTRPWTATGGQDFAAQGAQQPSALQNLFGQAMKYGANQGSGGGGGDPMQKIMDLLHGGLEQQLQHRQGPQPLPPVSYQPLAGDDPSAWMSAFRAMG